MDFLAVCNEFNIKREEYDYIDTKIIRNNYRSMISICVKDEKIFCSKKSLININKDPAEIREIFEGARIGEKLGNTNNNSFVKVYKIFLIDVEELTYLVTIMEYIEGKTLYTIWKGVRDKKTIFPREDIIKFSLWIFDIIENLHNDNIIHRDIKLKNIMYDKKNKRFVLLDFEFSKYCLKDRITFLKGTPYYLYPKMYKIFGECRSIIMNDKYIKVLKDADVWSSLICIFCLMEMKDPYNIDNENDFYRVLRERTYFFRMKSEERDIRELVSSYLNFNEKIDLDNLIQYFTLFKDNKF